MFNSSYNDCHLWSMHTTDTLLTLTSFQGACSSHVSVYNFFHTQSLSTASSLKSGSGGFRGGAQGAPPFGGIFAKDL